MDKKTTIRTINDMAIQQIPFIFVISYDGDNNRVVQTDEAIMQGIYIDIPGYSNHSFSPQTKRPFDLKAKPVDDQTYKEAFDRVMESIRYGNTFLLNLTFPTQIETNYSLKEIFYRSEALYRMMIEDKFVTFSPERFVKTEKGIISSNPMKGTIDASIPNAITVLTSDPKEDAEHNTIVDLIRNDLSSVAKDIRVKRFKYIDKIKTHRGELLQMSSEISGKLPGDFHHHLGDILFRLLPAGSVTGAPKPKTLEIINNIESYSRGFYTGIFGYFDGENLDSAVTIRYIERIANRLVFKSGGGITHMSQWKSEYQEMIDKVYVPIY